MNPAAQTRTFEVRHGQLARAAIMALAAVMITFSQDHSAVVGLAVFSGCVFATGLIFVLSAWLSYPAGHRWPSVLLAVVSVLAGMASGIPQLRSVTMYFAVVISWAVLAGLIELLVGVRSLRRGDGARSLARDAVVIGGAGLMLAVALVIVPPQFALDYTVKDAGQFTLTGITIAVGLFGGYAAIVAVYLGIAGLSPRPRVGAAVTGAAEANNG